MHDAPPLKFMAYVFEQLPAPRGWDGQPLEQKGVLFHGSQLLAMKSSAAIIQVRGGVRAGKSFWTAAKIYVDMRWRWENGHYGDLYWVIGPTFKQAEEEMNHLHALLTAGGVIHDFSTPKDSSWTISFPSAGTLVETKTGTEAARIASKACRIVALVEANQQADDVFRNAKERVIQTRGGVLVNGTFENEIGGTWFRDAATNWPRLGIEAEGESYPLPTWDNRVLFPGGRTDPTILEFEKHEIPSVFMERFGGEPSRSSVLVFPQADRRYQVAPRFPHLRNPYRTAEQQVLYGEFGLSFDPEKPVTLFSDPGSAHAYAVLAVQWWGNTAWVVDAVYRWNRTASQVIAECADRWWAPNVDRHVMDFAATQHNANGAPVLEQWQVEWSKRTGKWVSYVAQQVPLSAGYERHKKALLNAWPEEKAQDEFNKDLAIVSRVTDPNGPRLMFAPEASPPLFGGNIDGRSWQGEYALHKNRRNAMGKVTSDDPIPLDDDAIKAINYGLYDRFGAADNRPEVYKLLESGFYIPMEIAV